MADTGWQIRSDDDPYIARMAGKATVWWLTCPGNDGDYEVLAPSDQSYKDYSLRVSELIRTLSIVEDRSELDVCADLVAAAT